MNTLSLNMFEHQDAFHPCLRVPCRTAARWICRHSLHSGSPDRPRRVLSSVMRWPWLFARGPGRPCTSPRKTRPVFLSPEDNIAAEIGQLETSLRQGRAVKFSHERNAALSANQPTPTRPARITKCHNPSRQFRDAEKPRRNLVDFFFNMAVHQSPLLPGARRGRRLRMQGSRALITADLWTIPDDRSPPTSCRRRGRG